MTEREKLEKLYDDGSNTHYGRVWVVFYTKEPPTNCVSHYDKSKSRYYSFERPLGIEYEIRAVRPKSSSHHKYLKKQASRRTRHSSTTKQNNEYKKDFDMDWQEF